MSSVFQTGISVRLGLGDVYAWCTEEDHDGERAVRLGFYNLPRAKQVLEDHGWVFADEWAVCPVCRERILDGD